MKQADLIELIDYQKETGKFFWKKPRRGVRVGVELGCDNGFGYKRITVLGRSYYAHRLAWLYCHGEMPKGEIDHINGVKSDNRIENLRDVTSLENQNNRLRCQKNNKLLTLGVSLHKKANKYQAHICIYKKRFYLGLFDTVEDAASAYIKARKGMQNECI